MDKRTVTRVRTPSGAGVVLLVLAAAAWAVSASGACVPSPAGLVGWWPGEGNANDIIGTDNGILQGGATANAAGEVGQAFSLDGTNSYVQISDNAALRPTNLTVEAWVLFRSLNSAGNATAGQQYIVFKQNTRSSNFEGYYLAKERRSGGDVFVFDVSSAAGQVVEVASSPMIATGVWYHVAAMRGSNFIQLFVNGQSVAQATVSFAQDYGNFPLYFGTSGQSYWDRKFSGLLDEVSLYNRALSSTEVAAIYSAGAAGKCRGPQGPSIVTPPQSQSVAVGSNAFFTVKAAGTAPLSYQWVFNGAPLSDGTQFSGTATATLWLTNAQPANTGNYTVVVTNLTGSVTSAVGVLTVLAPPSLTAQPQSSTNVAGTTASFSATAAGSAPLVYQWKFNGGNLANGGRISGATSNTLTITGVQPTDAGNYTLVVTNAVGAVTSSVAILAVLGPPVITVPPASQTVAAGTTLSLSVSASGTLPLSYQWLFNGAALSDGTQFSGTATPTLWLTNAQPANAGGYSVVVTNVVGSVTSAVATLTVNMVGACVPPPAGLVGWWAGGRARAARRTL